MDQKLKARLEQYRQDKENCFKAIDYGTLPISVKRLIFEKAWDMGHSGGQYEVENFYQILTELVEEIFKSIK